MTAPEDMTGFHGRIKCAIELQGRTPGLPRHPLRPAREQGLLRQAFREAHFFFAVAEPA